MSFWISIFLELSLPRRWSGSESRVRIDTLAWLIEEAFDGDPSHSLLANLQDLREEDWTASPEWKWSLDRRYSRTCWLVEMDV